MYKFGFGFGFICMFGHASFVVSMEMHFFLPNFFTLAVISFFSDVVKSHDVLMRVSVACVCTIGGYFFPAVAMFILSFMMSFAKGLLYPCLKSCWALKYDLSYISLLSALSLPANKNLNFHRLQEILLQHSCCTCSQITWMLFKRHHGPKVFSLTQINGKETTDHVR